MSTASAAKPQRSFWIAVMCGAMILTIGIGARQSFGIFQKPIAADLKVGRELWSFANALSLLSIYRQEDVLPESEGLTAGRLREIIGRTTYD